MWGLILLVVGYRRDNRNLLLTAAGLLFLVGGLSDFAAGFHQDFMMSRTGGAVLEPKQVFSIRLVIRRKELVLSDEKRLVTMA